MNRASSTLKTTFGSGTNALVLISHIIPGRIAADQPPASVVVYTLAQGGVFDAFIVLRYPVGVRCGMGANFGPASGIRGGLDQGVAASGWKRDADPRQRRARELGPRPMVDREHEPVQPCYLRLRLEAPRIPAALV